MRRCLILFLASLAFAEEISFQFAGLTLTPDSWDKEAKFNKLAKFARQAAAHGAQVVVAPEGFLEGYVGNEHRSPGLTREKYFSVGEAVDGPLMTRVSALARELRIYLSVGYAEHRRDKMFNSSVIFSPDGRIAGH